MKIILLLGIIIGTTLSISSCVSPVHEIPRYFYAKPLIITPTTKYDYFIPGSDSDIYYYSY